MKQAKLLMVEIVMRLVVVIVLTLPGVLAVVEDPAHVLSGTEKEAIDAITPSELCVVLKKEATAQTAVRLFKERKEQICTVLAVYSQNDKKLRIAQADEGPAQRLLNDDVKKALLVFEEVRSEESPFAALLAAVESISTSLTQISSNIQCSNLKDGVCEKNCPKPDLDCLCGNGVCEYFEQETCTADCEKKEWLCAAITDGVCDSACVVRDLDCRFGALKDRLDDTRIATGISAGTMIALLAMLVMALSVAIIIMLHQKMKLQENKKGLSLIPSKMFTFVFTVVVLTIGMFLFLMIGERTAETESSAAPGAAYGVAVYRILNSPQCFVHVDEKTDLPDTGLIDVQKFTQRRLDDCFMIQPNAAEKECLKLELYDYRLGEKKLIAELQTANFAQCATVHRLQKQPYAVRLWDNEEAKPGLIMITAKKGE